MKSMMQTFASAIHHSYAIRIFPVVGGKKLQKYCKEELALNSPV